jgi:predicted phage terminase large subunit-like protein
MMSDRVIKAPKPHPSQARALRDARRFTVVAAGRRWGKSTLALRILVRNAAHGKRVGYFAPTYKYLVEMWDVVAVALDPITVARRTAERRIRLINGGEVEFWSLDRDGAGRSRKYHIALIDEAALVKDLAQAWTSDIRPTLADERGSAWFLSTPRGKQAFYDLFRRAEHDSEWFSIQCPTRDNPRIAESEIEAMRRDMPAHIAAQEIDAQFLDDAGALFRRADIRVVDDAPPGLRWVRAYDLAASTRDSADFTASVACAVDAATGVAYLRGGWRMRAAWPDVRRAMVETMRAEAQALHVVEQALHGLAATQELVRDPALYGIAIRAQAVDKDKYSRALPLAARAEQGLLRIVRGAWVDDWIDEATRFPHAAHDDYVDAATLAYAAAARSAATVLFDV